MNNPGGQTGQFNGNVDIYNEVNPHQPDRLSMPDLNPSYQIENSNIVPNNESNGALGLNISYSSSLTESPQRFPYRLSRLDFVQHQRRTHSIAEISMALSAEDVGNNHDNNMSLPLSLSSHPSGSRGEGIDGGFSANKRILPFKRSYCDLASAKSLTGESSTRGAQFGIAKEFSASPQVHSNNNVMNTSFFRNELASIHQSSDSEAMIGHSTRLASNMQNQTQVATIPQAIIRANRLLNNNSRGQHVAIPNQAHLFHQSGRSPFISSSRTADGEFIEPLHNQSVIQGNLMHNPQYGRGNRANDSEHSRFSSGTTHLLGNLLNHEQHGSSSRNVNSPNVSLVPLGNSRTANENSSLARSESQARGNVRPLITSLLLDRNRLMDEVRATIAQIMEVAQQRNMSRVDWQQDIQILRTMLNIPPHGQVATIEQNQDANMGLAEEEILKHIKRENFELVGKQTPENKEACCICQVDYVNGEEVGRLDCVHRFHITCITQWLVIKNLCPICVQTALATDGDDDE